MKGRGRFQFVTLGTLLALGAAACQKPEPPQIVAKDARVTAIGVGGLNVVVRVEATNPNRITLTAQSFTGHAKLDGKLDFGTVTIQKPVVLPPNTPTTIEVPMTMPWTDVRAIATIAQSPRPMPYVVEGTAKIGGENINVDVPFTVSGTVTAQQIAAAAVNSIPAIPGLTAPPN